MPEMTMKNEKLRIQKAKVKGKSDAPRPLTFSFLLLNFAFFHGGKPHNWHDLWRTWGWEPVVLISLALSAILYIRGVRLLWREASTGRGVRRREAACFAGGWLALFVALVSPLHPWGRVLFSAHMTQHEVLMLVAAPLFVLSRPLLPFLWALPVPWARMVGGWGKLRAVQGTWRALTNPLVAWAVHAAALWAWHIPVLFDATLESELVHTLQHLSFFLTALLFWWAVVNGRQGIIGYGAATLYMFTTSVHSGLLGALITFASSLWYTGYQTTTQSWGLTPLEDQQLGGLIMWVPAGLVYIAAGLILFAGWLREAEARARRREAASAYAKQG
jgi:putative membrane protein